MANNSAFNTIQANKLKRAAHDLSHSRKFTMNMGDLVPFFVQDVLPGDTFQLKTETLVRLMPMIAPIYHNVNIYQHFFFVPNRIIWNDWEDFITGGEDGTAKPIFPRFTSKINSVPNVRGLGPGELADYLGVPVRNFPTGSTANLITEENAFSQLPFRAYQLIYNEYYRDQNLENEISISKSSGITELGALNSSSSWHTQALILRKRAWEKDYFTSALPWTQRGTQMALPMQGDAPLVAVNQSDGSKVAMRLGNVSSGQDRFIMQSQIGALTGDALVADLSNISTTTINELRQAFQIQRWLERSARSGSRYTEVLQSFFGVRPRDSRLQRPEYLGGAKMPIAISEVLQTSESGSTALGEFAGHGISYGSSAKFRKYFDEHGIVIGIMSVLPRTAYCDGMPKYLRKFDKHDYFWQEFAHLGEQPIKNEEIFFNYAPASPGEKNEDAFGYTARYNEYRYVPDTIHGQMLTSLKHWHMARMFDSLPPLNKDFVQSNPTNRIFAVQDNSHKLIVQTYSNFKAVRPVPKYGEPLGI